MTTTVVFDVVAGEAEASVRGNVGVGSASASRHERPQRPAQTYVMIITKPPYVAATAVVQTMAEAIGNDDLPPVSFSFD